MGLFGKQQDPISEREKALNEEIAALEAQIKKLNERGNESNTPKFSTRAKQPISHDPIFEQVAPPSVFNAQPKAPPNLKELGARSFAAGSPWQRIKAMFKGRPSANPQLVNYLAAGSLQGFRPLRYEKRVARNRFIGLAVLLLFLIWGILAAIRRW